MGRFVYRHGSVYTLALMALMAVTTVSAFYSFRNRIPNGVRVPDPCHPGDRWYGVGHKDSRGGGTLNPFGEDLKAAGDEWTVELCEQDSDDDGVSNGEELGDPDCVWKIGDQPSTTEGITHPGVTEDDC